MRLFVVFLLLVTAACGCSSKERSQSSEQVSCVEDQRELERSFDPSRVPESFRALSSWASRYGVGDDVCRPYLLNRLEKTDRDELVRAVDQHGASIHAWLDSFPEGKMSDEAAAFMYLSLGVEEIRDSE